MDDEDVRALVVLQLSNEPLSERVQLRHVATCPHCGQGFGSASLPIHMPRCRAHVEQDTQQQKKPIRRKQAPSLVDLCLRFVTKHFESICMDKIVAFPEAEAALVAAMPPNLVHRMVVALVKDSKRAKAKYREGRAMTETLESALQGARRDVAQLESARDWASISRARMAKQQHVSDRLQRELDATKTALAMAETDNQKLQLRSENAEKKTLRLDAKINSLTAEKVALTKAAKEAQRREMEATRRLAAAKKALIPGVSCTPQSARRSDRKTAQNSVRRCSPKSLSCGSENNAGPRRSSAVIARKRPRSEGSKIPYPPSIQKDKIMCESSHAD
ncbi:hypothetical protein PF005_g14389 [Phytophthora fragariae]|uniref:Uncharacterized protein n=1 Tax=Phytophthora fragariae TaxID=53985 RepID=A0A6A3YN77_9STRA|nr:hypothetical protein PF010_g14318 [Phytophthora fragariae]KAE9102468.1 hypothetical protein PF007_g14756 [Phytophthora fragariae]KAE9202935.1 hypothetical protein PF005_g14389 [Phytophthora fragariae]KAE9220074.1 hypothetical protein PF002_g16000 [Phytophthora fragariae]